MPEFEQIKLAFPEHKKTEIMELNYKNNGNKETIKNTENDSVFDESKQT